MDLLLPGGFGSGDYNDAGHQVTPNATETHLIDALAVLERGDIEFVILEDNASKMFMQVAGDSHSGYILEYNTGQDDSMFRAHGSVSGIQITAALTAFLNRDSSWRTLFDWERLSY